MYSKVSAITPEKHRGIKARRMASKSRFISGPKELTSKKAVSRGLIFDLAAKTALERL